MNLKVANLVAVQFGVFAGIMSWLAYSHLPIAGPRTATTTQEQMRTEPVPAVAPVFKPGEQPSQTVDYRAEREETQPVAEQPVLAMHEYSAAAVQQYSALAAKQYYEQIAPRRYVSSTLEKRSVVAEAPAYPEVKQESETAPVEYLAEPETIAYSEPAQFIVYPQSQFVVFSNRRRVANRCRPTLFADGAPLANRNRRHQNRPRSHLRGPTEFGSPAAAFRRPANSLGVVHRRHDSTPSCRANQGFRPRRQR
jgi:hypothetical protein